MTFQITIIGLGQIGASIGLSLAERPEIIHRVGHDPEPTQSRHAQKLGAVDKVIYNLPKAVRDADLVVVAQPVDQLRETLQVIAPDLKQSAVVMDTTPIKRIVMEWARELIPAGRHFVSLVPLINPAHLHTPRGGVEAARADLFKGGLMAIITPGGTDSAAIKLAVDLTGLLGATPLFADPAEVDSLMAATYILPNLLAAALVTATAEQPGWLEGRKFAGRAYAQVTSLTDPLEELLDAGSASVHNRENVLRVLDNLLRSLQLLRGHIASQDDQGLRAFLEKAGQARAQWLGDRLAGNWASDGSEDLTIPSNQDLLGRMFFGSRPRRDPPDRK